MSHLSCFVRVRDGDSVRRVRDVVERLVLVDVLQDQTQMLQMMYIYCVFYRRRLEMNVKLKLIAISTDRAERERQRLQDVQHGPQHAAAPQQVRETKKKNTKCLLSLLAMRLKTEVGDVF